MYKGNAACTYAIYSITLSRLSVCVKGMVVMIVYVPVPVLAATYQ